MNRFALGQRWTSKMEPELGVGVVAEIDGRRVRIRFPQNGVERTYGASSAPLERVTFHPGDRIRGDDGISLTVAAVETEDGLHVYHGDGRQLREDRLAATLAIHQPNARLMAGQRDPARLFDLRVRVLEHRYRTASSPVCGFVGGRVEPIPHQFAIADKVCRQRFPRVLLADEAGLGKTIEAGLILHRLIAVGQIARVLVVVPDALVVQWYVEMTRRFNLRFRILDDAFLAALPENCAEGAFFENEPLMLCGFALLSQASPALQTQLMTGEWDTVVVDEAHRIQQGGRFLGPAGHLANKAPGLILITATPGPLAASEAAPAQVFRTRRCAVSGFPGRKVQLVPLDPGGNAEAVCRRINDAFFQDGQAGDDPDAALMESDPRIDWLTGFAHTHRDEKILLICRTRQTVNALLQALEKKARIKTGRFHEGMTLVQRDRNAAWFADPDGATLLGCSEIGSEGRNFQFANHLVLFDLPADPELLEQRIGRLDRIGRSGVVQVMVPFVTGTAGEVMARWYHEALNAFETYTPAAAWVTHRFYSALAASIEDWTHGAGPGRLERMIRGGCIAAARRLRRIQRAQAHLLPVDTLSLDNANRLVATIRQADADAEFFSLIEGLLDVCGIGMDLIAPSIFRLEPDERYAHPLPGFRPMGLTVTTDRTIALAREELDFLTRDHPLVDSAMAIFLGSGKGNAVFTRWKASGPPLVLLDMVFVPEAPVGSNSSVERFLPSAPIRVVVDQDLKSGQDLLSTVSPEQFEDGSPALFSTMLQAVSARIPQMIAAGQAAAASGIGQRIEKARQRAARAFEARLEHLEKLRQTHSAVNAAAVRAAGEEHECILAAISRAQLRLDAVRLVVKGAPG